VPTFESLHHYITVFNPSNLIYNDAMEPRNALESGHNILSAHAKTSPVDPDKIVEKAKQHQSQADSGDVLLLGNPNLVGFQPNDSGNPFN
jgi:hypothetical protein